MQKRDPMELYSEGLKMQNGNVPTIEPKEQMRKMGSFVKLCLLSELLSLKCQKWLIFCILREDITLRLKIFLALLIKLRALMILARYTFNKELFHVVHLAFMLCFLCYIFQWMINIIKLIRFLLCGNQSITIPSK